jgi:hypothetical protein
MQVRKTNHVLLYLACEQMVFGVKQLQQQKKLGQTIQEIVVHKG